MTISRFSVPLYKYKISVVALLGEESITEISDTLKKEGVDDKNIALAESQRAYSSYNGASCLINRDKLKQIIVVYRQTNKENFFTCLFHELRHAVDNIIEDTHLEGEEASAYLTGFVFWNGIKKFL